MAFSPIYLDPAQDVLEQYLSAVDPTQTGTLAKPKSSSARIPISHGASPAEPNSPETGSTRSAPTEPRASGGGRRNLGGFKLADYERAQKGLEPAAKFFLLKEQIITALVQYLVLKQQHCGLNFSEPGAGKTLQSLFQIFLSFDPDFMASLSTLNKASLKSQLPKRLTSLKLMVIGPVNAQVAWVNETMYYGLEIDVYLSYDKLRGTAPGKVGDGYLTRRDTDGRSEFTITKAFLEMFKTGYILVFDEIHKVMNESRQRSEAAHTLILGALNYIKSHPECRSELILLTGSLTNKPDTAPWYTSMLGHLPKPSLNEDEHVKDYLSEIKQIMLGPVPEQPKLVVFEILEEVFAEAMEANDAFALQADANGDEYVTPEASARLIETLASFKADKDLQKVDREICALFHLILTKYTHKETHPQLIGYLLQHQLKVRPVGSAKAVYTDIEKRWRDSDQDQTAITKTINRAWKGFIIPYQAYAAPRPKSRFNPIIVNKFYKIRSKQDRRELDAAISDIVDKIEAGSMRYSPFDADFNRICNLMVDTFVFRALTTLKQNPKAKVLVVMPALDALKRVQNALNDAGFPCEYYTGGENVNHRISIVRRFNNPKSNLRAIAGQLTAISNSVSLDDKFGNEPRYTYAFPTFNFLEEYQLIFRTARATSMSQSTTEFIYPDVEGSDILRNQRERRIEQNEHLKEFGRVEGIETFDIAKIPTVKETPGEITEGTLLHLNKKDTKKPKPRR